MLQLLEKAEIRDVLATAGVQFEQLKRMGAFGGVVLQLQGIMQKGFNKVTLTSSMNPSSALNIAHLTVASQQLLLPLQFSLKGKKTANGLVI